MHIFWKTIRQSPSTVRALSFNLNFLICFSESRIGPARADESWRKPTLILQILDDSRSTPGHKPYFVICENWIWNPDAVAKETWFHS